jgi:hypothetical protein
VCPVILFIIDRYILTAHVGNINKIDMYVVIGV